MLLRHACSPRILLTGLLLAPLALGCNKPAAETKEEAKPAPVKVDKVEEETYGQWTELLGTTLAPPNRAARVTAAVEGRVVTVLGDGKDTVAEGERVPAGQVIARLDDHIVRANKARLEAQLREFEEQKKQSAIAVETAQIDADRYEKLSADAATRASVSPVDVKRARLALESAQSVQRGLVAKEQSAQADLRAAEAQLSLYTIQTPITGRLGLVQVQRGQTLTPGTLVTEVVDLDEIDALCYVPPEVTARLRLEQTAVIIATDSASRFKTSILIGEVVYIAAQASAETGNFAVKVRFRNQDFRHRLVEEALEYVAGTPIRLPDDDRALRANAVVRVYVMTEPAEERMSIPDEALMEDRSPPTVVAVQKITTRKNDEGKDEKVGEAKVLQAVVGVRDRAGHHVEILALIDPTSKDKKPVPLIYDGDNKKPLLVVTEGGHGLRDGDPVKIEEEEEEKKD
jgi:RND family efflux transporter MFP subunit